MSCYSHWRFARVAAGKPEPAGFREHLAGCARCAAGLQLALARRWVESRAGAPAPFPAAHLAPAELLRLAQGGCAGPGGGRAVAHLAGCEACRALLAGFARAAREIDSGAVVQPAAAGLREARALWSRAGSASPASAGVPYASAGNPVTICLLADDSGSMAGRASEEATESIRDFVSLMQSSCAGRGSCFRLLLVKFGDFPSVLVDRVPILDVDLRRITLAGTSGGTDMAGALELAASRLAAAAARPGALPPLVLLYSDGRPTGPDPRPAGRLLKNMAYPAGQHPLLVTCGLGTADDSLLQGLASSPRHYRRLDRPAELRQFLRLVGTSMSTAASGGGAGSAAWDGISEALAA